MEKVDGDPKQLAPAAAETEMAEPEEGETDDSSVAEDELLEIVRASQTTTFIQQQANIHRRYSGRDLSADVEEEEGKKERDNAREKEGTADGEPSELVRGAEATTGATAAASRRTEEETKRDDEEEKDEIPHTTVVPAPPETRMQIFKEPEKPKAPKMHSSVPTSCKEGVVPFPADAGKIPSVVAPTKTEAHAPAEFREALLEDAPLRTEPHRPPTSTTAASSTDGVGVGLRIEGVPGAHSVGDASYSSGMDVGLGVEDDVLDVESEGPEPSSDSDHELLVEARVVDDESQQRANDRRGDPIIHAVPAESKFARRFKLAGREFEVNLLLLNAAVVCLVVVVAVAVTAAASLSSNTPIGTDENPLPPEMSSAENPIQRPSRLDTIRAYVTDKVTPNEALFDDSETPQYQALQWIAHEDPAQVPMEQGLRILQRYILAVLYFSTGGPTHWENSLNFLTEDHECNWKFKDEFGDEKGVIDCEAGWGEGITTMWLYWNNMTGTIPSELGGLDWIQSLSLGINNLHGTIPASIATGPQSLKQIFLNNNDLEGTVPSEWAGLMELQTMTVYANPQLTGDLNLHCQEQELFYWLAADCGGDVPPIDCPCCSVCCDMELGECCDTQIPSGGNASCWDPTPVKDESFL